MKREWPSQPLGDMCDVIGGGTPPKDNPSFYGGTIPWATVRDMRSEVIDCTEHSITAEAVNASATNIIPKNNVVIATRVGLGKVCLLAQETAINQDLRGIVPKSEKVQVRFLFHWLKFVAPQIIEEGTGATVQGVRLPFIKALQLPIPPKIDQERIVAILDKAFAKIAALRSLTTQEIEDSRELKASFLQSELDKHVGEGWIPLLDLCTRLTNGFVGPTRDIYVESGVPYLLARHVKAGILNFDGRTHITDEFNRKNKKSTLLAGDVLLVQSGHIGQSAVVPESHAGHNCHAMIVITPKKGLITGEFLQLVFSSSLMQRRFKEIRSGSTVPHLTCGEVRKLRIPVPSLVAQKSISDVLNDMSSQVGEIERAKSQKLAALSALKQSLLHQAFSGNL